MGGDRIVFDLKIGFGRFEIRTRRRTIRGESSRAAPEIEVAEDLLDYVRVLLYWRIRKNQHPSVWGSMIYGLEVGGGTEKAAG